MMPKPDGWMKPRVVVTCAACGVGLTRATGYYDWMTGRDYCKGHVRLQSAQPVCDTEATPNA